jgi:hypothetical protein
VGRPAGSKNLMTREKIAQVQKLIVAFGDPLENMAKKKAYWEEIFAKETAKGSRHQNKARIKEALAEIKDYDDRVLQYYHPKQQSIASQSEIKQAQVVIRAPETISDTNAWLAAHAPKHITQQSSATPVMAKFRDALQGSYRLADELNIDDADAVLREARRRLEDEQ